MRSYSKYLITGLLFTTSALLMTGCRGPKKDKLSAQEIREYRTERYLDRVATDANLALSNAEEKYNMAIEEQQSSDSTTAKKIINQYEPQYLNAKAVQNRAFVLLNNNSDESVGNETALEKYNNTMKKVNPVIEKYEKAVKELDIARGTGVREAENDLEFARSNARKILSYRRIFNTPIEERTKEDSATLQKFYNLCRIAGNRGWGNNISSRLVKEMETQEIPE